MTLEELKASAPRSFDKTLIDLLVAIQSGGQPIVVHHDQAPAVDVSPVMLRIAAELDHERQKNACLEARVQQLEAVLARLAMEATAEAA